VKTFTPALETIVGRVSRRRGDALLGAGVDDQTGFAVGQHMRPEGAGAVDDAHHVDAEDRIPIGVGAEDRGFRTDAGIVHQQMDAAEALDDGALERCERGLVRDVGLDCHDMLFAGDRLQFVGSPGQPVAAEIGDDDAHAGSCEMFRGGKPDAGGAAGDDRDVGWLDDGAEIGHGSRLSFGIVRSQPDMVVSKCKSNRQELRMGRIETVSYRRADGRVRRCAGARRQLRFRRRGH
jgi:hypothetical protein